MHFLVVVVCLGLAFTPTTATTTYCFPPAMYVTSAPVAFFGSSIPTIRSLRCCRCSVRSDTTHDVISKCPRQVANLA